MMTGIKAKEDEVWQQSTENTSMRSISFEKEEAYFLLGGLECMKTFCTDRMSDHIPYSFDRECHAFRVMTSENVSLN